MTKRKGYWSVDVFGFAFCVCVCIHTLVVALVCLDGVTKRKGYWSVDVFGFAFCMCVSLYIYIYMGKSDFFVN